MNAIIPGVPGQKQYIARFHAGDFEMAYQHGPHDELYNELRPGWCQKAPAAPYKNGIMGSMYGTNTVPVDRTLFCMPFVQNCAGQSTRAPAPSTDFQTPMQPPNSICPMR